MKRLRLRHRLLIIALLAAMLLAAAHGGWFMLAGGPAGAWGHALLFGGAVGAAALAARTLERQLASECGGLVRGFRRVRDGEFGRVSGRWTEPLVERPVDEIDARTGEIARHQRNLHERIGEATRQRHDTFYELETRNVELESARAEAEADDDLSATGTDAVEPVRAEACEELVYDPEDGLRRAGGRGDIAEELFAMLLRHLPQSREELHAAAGSADRRRLRSAAHRLKGATAYCGVPRLRRELEHLEQTIDAGEDPMDPVERVLGTIDAVATLERRPSEPVTARDMGR